MSANRVILISNSSKSVLNFRGKLIEGFQTAGLEVVVLLRESEGSEEIIKTLQERGCIVETLYLNRAGINIVDDLRSLLSIYQVIKKYKPRYVLSYTIKPVIYGSLAAKLAGVKEIYPLITGLGYAFMNVEDANYKASYTQKIVFTLYKIALAAAKKVFFQNADDAALFEKMNLVALNKVVVVNGSGVDLSHYTYNTSILKNKDKNTPFKFLMLGRVIGDKGVREYVSAARSLKERYGDRVTFMLAGGLDTNPTAIKEDELYGWVNDGIIEYLGKLQDVRPIISDSHVFVLPSYREGTSRSILEAMAIGRPIVTTDVPGCRQLVEVGKNGFLVNVKSAESLESGLDKILNLDSEELLMMGEYSRKIVEEKYDVNKVNAHMLENMGILDRTKPI